jgi:hypothetical protein
LQSAAHAANSKEVLHIIPEAIRKDADRVIVRQRIGKAILTQIIADRNLSAESIAAAIKSKLIQIVGRSLHQNRNLQAGKTDRVRHRPFVAKVRQAYKDAGNTVRIFLKQLAAQLGVLPDFNCP